MSEYSVAGQAALTAERLAAVRLLFDAQRIPQTHDIVLASIFEHLESGPKSSHEVLAYVRKVWPGVAIDLPTLIATLEEAEVRGLTIREQPDFGGNIRWRLGSGGENDLTRSRAWANDTVGRFTSELAREARSTGVSTDPERFQLLSDLLLDTIVVVISDAFVARPAFEVVGDRHLHPAGYDLPKADSFIEARTSDEHASRFLSMMTRVALDPSQPFGTELVHNLATGYVLSAFVGRLDNPEARRALGALTGEVAILDTPVLLRLLGSPDSRISLMDTIARARGAGYQVIVHRKTFEELLTAIDSRSTSGVVTLIQQALDDGIDRENLRRLTGDGVVSAWLASEPTAGKGAYVPWGEFRESASKLETTLKAMGVDLIEPTYLDVVDSDRHMQFAAHLRERLKSRRNRRGVANIEHDASMLVTAYQRRSSNPSSADKMWPGALVITPDTYLNATYCDVIGTEDFPVAVTVGQWAGILAAASPPVDAEELARIVSTETSAHSLLMRAVGFPIEASIELARSLKERPLGMADLQGVQMSLGEVLADHPDVFSARGEDARKVAHEVLDRRMQRTDAAFSHQSKEQEAEVARVRRRSAEEVENANTRAQLAEQSADVTTKRLESLEGSLRDLSVELARRDKDAVTRSRRMRRLIPHVVIALLLIVGATALTSAFVSGADSIHAKTVVVSWVVIVIFVCISAETIHDTDRPWWLAITSLAIAPAAWLLLELLAG